MSSTRIDESDEADWRLLEGEDSDSGWEESVGMMSDGEESTEEAKVALSRFHVSFLGAYGGRGSVPGLATIPTSAACGFLSQSSMLLRSRHGTPASDAPMTMLDALFPWARSSIIGTVCIATDDARELKDRVWVFRVERNDQLCALNIVGSPPDSNVSAHAINGDLFASAGHRSVSIDDHSEVGDCDEESADWYGIPVVSPPKRTKIIRSLDLEAPPGSSHDSPIQETTGRQNDSEVARDAALTVVHSWYLLPGGSLVPVTACVPTQFAEVFANQTMALH
jgi:hypothetical protein